MYTRQKGILGNRPVIITFAVLVGMVSVAWLSGVLTPGVASADGYKSSFECAYAPLEECEGMEIALNSSQGNAAPGNGPGASVYHLPPGNSGAEDGAASGKCLLPGIPCTMSNDREASQTISQGYQAGGFSLPGGFAGTGEETAEIL